RLNAVSGIPALELLPRVIHVVKGGLDGCLPARYDSVDMEISLEEEAEQPGALTLGNDIRPDQISGLSNGADFKEILLAPIEPDAKLSINGQRGSRPVDQVRNLVL